MYSTVVRYFVGILTFEFFEPKKIQKMKNPFARRNRIPDRSPRTLSPQRFPSDRNHIYFTEPTGPTLQYAWAIDPEISFEAKGSTTKKSGRKSVGRLVQKLNCAAPSARNEDHDNEIRSMDTQRQVGQQQDHAWQPKQSQQAQIQHGLSWNCASPQELPEQSRDVVITVNNRNSSNRAGAFDPDSMYPGLVGSRGLSPHLMNTKSSIPPRHPASSPHIVPPKNAVMDSMTARKERWLKGLQRGYADDADAPSRISGGDDSVASNEFAQTAAGSTTSSDTDFTTESDDSENYKQPAPQKRGPNSSARRKAPQRKPPSTRGGGNDMWAGVVEDIGIFAGLILSDGTACVGGVADITRETVVDSCKPEASEY